MILSFRCKDTEKLAQGHHIRRWAAIERKAYRKLVQLELAMDLNDMKAPPENRLEPLPGRGKDRWKVRIGKRHSLRFRWTYGGAEDVEIVEENRKEA